MPGEPKNASSVSPREDKARGIMREGKKNVKGCEEKQTDSPVEDKEKNTVPQQSKKTKKDLERLASPSTDLPLLYFALMGNEYKVKRELDEEGTSVNLTDPKDGRTPLHLACLAGHHNIVSTLFSYGPNTHARDHNGRRPLHMAADEGHHHLLPLLLTRCLIEATDNRGMQAVHIAAQSGHLEFLQVLEKNGANLSGVCGINNSTALHLAAEKGHLEVVKWLLEQGISTSIRDSDNLTAEDRARTKHHKHVAHYLNKASCGSDHDDASKELTPNLRERKDTAAIINRPKEYTLTGYPTLRQSTPGIMTQRLLEAASDGDVVTVKQLMEEDVSLEECVKSGEEKGLRALHLAAWGGYEEVVEILLMGGAEAEAEAAGRRAVHWAAVGGHVETLQVLQKGGCDMHALTTDAYSALHLAAEQGNLEASHWLVKEAGIDVTLKNIDGRTALEIAKEESNAEIADFLHSEITETLQSAQGERPIKPSSRPTARKHMSLHGNNVPLDFDKRRSMGGSFYPSSSPLANEAAPIRRQKTVKGILHVHKQMNLKRLDVMQRVHVLKELRVWDGLRSAFVADHVIEEKDMKIHVFSSFCEGENLAERIKRRNRTMTPFPFHLVHSWTLGLTLALKHVHAQGLVHANITPNNIFFGGSGAPILGALGTQRFFKSPTPPTDEDKYKSPEVREGKPYTALADMWALGCCLSELVPQQDMSFYPKAASTEFSVYDYKKLVEALLNPIPEKRLTASQVLRLPLLEKALKQQLGDPKLIRLHQDVVRHMEALEEERAECKE